LAELLRDDELRRATGKALSIPVVGPLVVGFDGRYTSLIERGLM
jgi:hypothetical protein